MTNSVYGIDEFVGIDQSRGENALLPSMSPDACNMSCEDGNLAVSSGYVKHIPVPVPGTGTIRRLLMYRRTGGVHPLVLAGNDLYAWNGAAWTVAYTFATLTHGKLDAVETSIGGIDYLVLGTGENQLVKYDGTTASLFGSVEGLSDRHVLYTVMYRNRLFSAGDPEHPCRLYFSQLPGDARSIESWGPVEASPNVEGGHAEVGATSGDPIIALSSLSNQLLIFKKYSVYRLVGDRPSNYAIERLEAATGSLAHTSLVTYGDAAYYMTPLGLYVFNGVTVHRSADAMNIRHILADADVSDSRAALVRDKLYCSLRLLGGEAAMIEYDMHKRAYMLRRGFAIADLCAHDDSLYLINENRYVCRFGEGTTYDGAKIDAYWNTPLTDLYDKGCVKELRGLYLRGESDEAQSALLIDATVGGVTDTHRVLLPESLHEVLEIPLKNEGRTFYLRFYNESGGHFSVKGGVELAMTKRRRVE